MACSAAWRSSTALIAHSQRPREMEAATVAVRGRADTADALDIAQRRHCQQSSDVASSGVQPLTSAQWRRASLRRRWQAHSHKQLRDR